jgi:hypothetical protein
MANIFQSSQNKTTTAPSYYTDYLSNLANAGQSAAKQAQFAGAQPLQTKAFQEVGENFGAALPAVATGQGLVGQAAGQDVTGAAAPYLQAGTNASPLCAANPYLQRSVGTSPAELAAEYMNPYLDTAVKSMSDIAQRNIRNNLSPQATAAAVGSGQFGSQRGAQVLGQVQSDAQQSLNAEIAKMMSTGFGQALCAAGKQNALGVQAGSTAANAQQAQNQANLTAAQTAAKAAANQGNLLNQAGTNMGTLAQTGANMNLACINALATLGGQQQTIEQNRQNFPLSTLSSLSGLLQGYSIPVGTKTTVCASPLSTLAGGVTGAVGLYDKSPGFKKLVDYGVGKLGDVFGGSPVYSGGQGGTSGTDIYEPPFSGSGGTTGTDFEIGDIESVPCFGCTCWFFAADGGLIKAKAGGSIGCASTKYRGALPYKKG